MNLSKFLIGEDATLMEAIAMIEENHHGIIMAKDSSGAVFGLATDGDIRRTLISGVGLSESILSAINRDFFWATYETPREVLLKSLDHKIRVIPILDENMKLVDVISRDNLPVQNEGAVYARARAPVRVSFSGGGSDLTYYFSEKIGAVINATISLYSHATLRLRDDKKILVYSYDLGEKISCENFDDFLVNATSRLGLIKAVLKLINPTSGFELFLNSDFPIGSGLGGSAALVASILGCFNQFRKDCWDQHEMAELSFQAERLYLGLAGGWQDQYATVFGGVNFIEFGENNVVSSLRIHPDILYELEDSLILCATGISHNSGELHVSQKQNMSSEDKRCLLHDSVNLTYEIRNYLLRGRLNEFGGALHKAWTLKRDYSEDVSNTKLDALYEFAIKNGASGGKLLGAGGGGFFLFYVSPFKRLDLINALESEGFDIVPFRFEMQGLQSWKTRYK
jgi:D-glycero-alpha-D-manno-heptose-7-phosphate kinase